MPGTASKPGGPRRPGGRALRHSRWHSHLTTWYRRVLRHVLFVAPSFAPYVGGAQTFQRAMARRLVADGHRVTVLTTAAHEVADFWLPYGTSAGSLRPRKELDGVSVERLAIRHPWPAPYAFGLARRAGLWLQRSGLPTAIQRPLLRRLSRWMPPLEGLEAALDRLVPWADLIQAVDSSWDGLFVTAAAAAQRYGKPLVVIPLMHLSDAHVRAHFRMDHQVEAYRDAEAVVALSRREADALADMGVAPARIHILAMGIDPGSALGIRGRDVAEFRHRHDVRGRVAAFLGANTLDKGAFTLALAVAQLNAAGLEVDLVCAGPGRDRLAAFVRHQPPRVRSALQGRLHVLGIVSEDDKHRLLATCELLALPSRVDAFGIVILEAWLHAKPVIGTDAGGIADLVTPEETGLLVPFGDVSALASAIRRLMTEPELAKRLGTSGQQRVLHCYTWDKTYRRLLAVYSSALAKRGG